MLVLVLVLVLVILVVVVVAAVAAAAAGSCSFSWSCCCRAAHQALRFTSETTKYLDCEVLNNYDETGILQLPPQLLSPPTL